MQAALLEARDARGALLLAHRPPAGSALLAISLAIPGEEKEPPGALELFTWALAQALARLPGARPLHSGGDALGPFGLLLVAAPAEEVKRACLALEEARPAARLLDLDVYQEDGRQLDRAALGLPPRACLCCPAPAHECIRAVRHPRPEVQARAAALLGGHREAGAPRAG